MKLISLISVILISATLWSQQKNITFEVTSGRTMMEYSSYSPGTFKPGEFLAAYTNSFIEAIPEDFKGKTVIYYIEVQENGKVIHKHAFTKECPTSGWWKFNLIPNPNSSESIVFRHDWNGNLLRALNGLEPGVHPLTFLTYLENEGKRIQTGYGEIKYDNSAPTELDLLKTADEIDKNSTFDPEKELSEWIDKNGGWDAWKAGADADLAESDAEDAARDAKNSYKVTIKNNCKDEKLFTVNQTATVYSVKGNSTTEISLSRGKDGVIHVNNLVVAKFTEKNEGGIVIICP
ncbi:MAG: hypothetical protein ABIJ16_11160 [Bacteroidota bacterium]